MKKILAMACALLMATSLAACSKPADQPVDNGGDDKPTENQVLKVAAFKGGYGEVWEPLARKFEELHEGVTVELVTSPKIDEELRPQLQAGDYPDVIQYNIGQPSGFAETLIKEDALLDISDVFADPAVKDRIADGFADNAITAPYGDGKTYLAPLFYSPCGLWYNKALFGEGGYELPETWDDMWALGDQLKSENKGVSLFTYPVKGYFDSVLYALLNQAGGDDFYGKALNYDPETWTSEPGKLVLDTIGKLVSEYTAPEASANANSGNFKMNQQAVLDNTVLFMPNGNWIIGEMGDAPRAEGFEWGFMPLPAFEEGGARYSYTFFEQMYVPKEAANPELAKEFIKFMYSDEAIEIMLNNKTEDGAPSIVVQPVKGIVEKLDGDNKVIYSIYETPNTFPALGGFAATDSIEGLELKPVVFGPIDTILEGKTTVEEWQTQLTDAFVQFHAALK